MIAAIAGLEGYDPINMEVVRRERTCLGEFSIGGKPCELGLCCFRLTISWAGRKVAWDFYLPAMIRIQIFKSCAIQSHKMLAQSVEK